MSEPEHDPVSDPTSPEVRDSHDVSASSSSFPQAREEEFEPIQEQDRGEVVSHFHFRPNHEPDQGEVVNHFHFGPDREPGNGEVENHSHFRNPELEPQRRFGFTYRGNVSASDESGVIGDDTWSCVIVVLTFWFFVSMTLILGVYGSSNMLLGPNSSVLIQPNAIFVQSVKVDELDDTKPGLAVYGFYKTPPLDVVDTWSKAFNTLVAADSHKEWMYYLNEGSEINISYSVGSPSSPIFLIIAKGNEGLSQWLEDPTYPNTTLSWNIISGSGMIKQSIYSASSYYIALGNMNLDDVEVKLNLSISALLYNTSEAYYKCTFSHGLCTSDILFPKGNTILLTSPGPEQGTLDEEWSVRLSYGPRWVTYVIGIGAMTAFMILAFNFLNKIQCSRREGVTGQHVEVGSERAPLLSYKDDDLSSWGSSYDSLSNDEENLETILGEGEGKSGEGETSNNTRRLCAICFDAPRDCFFLPCGHCVACYECGTRIVEAQGTCPICRRSMKKVRKIFTV